jgi:hypothetical protein
MAVVHVAVVHVAVVHVRVIHTGDLVESCICVCACVCEETRRGDVVRAMYRARRTISSGLARGRGGARGAADNEQIDDYLLSTTVDDAASNNLKLHKLP